MTQFLDGMHTVGIVCRVALPFELPAHGTEITGALYRMEYGIRLQAPPSAIQQARFCSLPVQLCPLSVSPLTHHPRRWFTPLETKVVTFGSSKGLPRMVRTLLRSMCWLAIRFFFRLDTSAIGHSTQTRVTRPETAD